MLDKVSHSNALMLALSKTLDKWSDRDAIPEGSAYDISANITGEINGAAFALPVATRMTVGYDCSKATSRTPAIADVVGSLLGAIAVVCDEKTAQACADEVLTRYAETATVDSDAQFSAMAESLLAGLRQEKQINARGVVKAQPSAKTASVEFAEVA